MPRDAAAVDVIQNDCDYLQYYHITISIHLIHTNSHVAKFGWLLLACG